MNGSCTAIFYDVNQNIGGTASHLKRLLIDCREMIGNLHPLEIAESGQGNVLRNPNAEFDALPSKDVS